VIVDSFLENSIRFPFSELREQSTKVVGCSALATPKLLLRAEDCEISTILRVRDFSLYNKDTILWIAYITTEVVNPSYFIVSQHRNMDFVHTPSYQTVAKQQERKAREPSAEESTALA